MLVVVGGGAVVVEVDDVEVDVEDVDGDVVEVGIDDVVVLLRSESGGGTCGPPITYTGVPLGTSW